eukprot:c15748_g1_i1.p1 GENE.c15748_g1_i1~~c15748_g1_i1.p1  ORF type:complete len:287 (+),score=79.72 c15748_g1_i1:31-861(+)
MTGFISIVLVSLMTICSLSFPETGDVMTWGQANQAFADSIQNRDYSRQSAALDAADQYSGFRPSDQLTRGVPFSKAPRLNFEGFAQGKADGGIGSYVSEMTPYLASSHYINQIRKPLSNSIIYPAPLPRQDPRLSLPRGVSLQGLNSAFSTNPSDYIKSDLEAPAPSLNKIDPSNNMILSNMMNPGLGMNPAMMGGMSGMNPSMMGGMGAMGGMNPSMMGGMNPSMMGGMNPSMMGGMNPSMMGGMNPFQSGANPYSFQSPVMGSPATLMGGLNLQ